MHIFIALALAVSSAGRSSPVATSTVVDDPIITRFSLQAESCETTQHGEEVTHKTQRCLHGAISVETALGDVCRHEEYPLSCLASDIPASASYVRIRACFRCCMTIWTHKLGLARHFFHRRWYLFNEDGTEPFQHNLTEVLLTPGSLMKFADASFPPGFQKQVRLVGKKRDVWPCASKVITLTGKLCIIADGGMVVFRWQWYHDSFVDQIKSWALFGRDVKVLIEGDVALGDTEKWLAIGAQVFRTNPESGGRLTIHNIYPLGLSAWISVQRHELALEKHKVEDISRSELLFCSGYDRMHLNERRSAFNSLVRNGWNCSEAKLSYEEYMGRMARSKFVFSPMGAGYNCYRTWEALAVGAIVLVTYHPSFETLYRGLPVVMVKNWSAVVEPLLKNIWESIGLRSKFAPQSTSLAKAYLPYWLHSFFAHLGQDIE
eukprot:TRINITY_DN31936_c0_g1_i1.p1 TRINITY_DN31936_c0_g1~~TRINITY_DN31936_c0_g1_i1.p1  ORF type:complete len:433 (-),score=38.99 TRINITY_DN31936_c0_g1_i1:139-1437(-)